MDLSQYVPVMVAIITAAGTLIGTLFTVSLNGRSQRRRDTEQAMKEERDRLTAALAAETERADDNRHWWKTWKGEYLYFRAWVLSLGLTTEQLKDMPRPPEHR